MTLPKRKQPGQGHGRQLRSTPGPEYDLNQDPIGEATRLLAQLREMIRTQQMATGLSVADRLEPVLAKLDEAIAFIERVYVRRD